MMILCKEREYIGKKYYSLSNETSEGLTTVRREGADGTG